MLPVQNHQIICLCCCFFFRSFASGSYECRVGWACDERPRMIFRNLIAKPRREKVKKDGELPLIQPTQIGNDIVNIEAMRYQLRTQVLRIRRNNYRYNLK